MAYHLGKIKDREDFIRKIKKPAQLRNRTLRSIKKYLPKEEVKFLETQMIEDSIEEAKTNPPFEIKKNKKTVNKKTGSEDIIEKPVFANSYQRFEYLMEHGCTSVEERRWLTDYKNSDEYRLLYENE